MADRKAFKPANPKACAECPWRTANQGRENDPHGFYKLANLRRLWKGMRNGERMTCHPTDPQMDEFEGYEDTAEREVTHECTGSLILKQREFMRYQEIVESMPNAKVRETFRAYRAAHPKGMTLAGLRQVLEDAIFGGTPMGSGGKMARPNLNDAEVGHPDLVPWVAK